MNLGARKLFVEQGLPRIAQFAMTAAAAAIASVRAMAFAL
jgi:hypothetical protein